MQDSSDHCKLPHDLTLYLINFPCKVEPQIEYNFKLADHRNFQVTPIAMIGASTKDNNFILIHLVQPKQIIFTMCWYV
jgi:hypothetical protein